MRAGREIIQLKIIRKLDRSKIIEYSIEQYNTHIITSQLQRRPSEFIKVLTTRFSPPKCNRIKRTIIHRAALHCTGSFKSIFLEVWRVHMTLQYSRQGRTSARYAEA